MNAIALRAVLLIGMTALAYGAWRWAPQFVDFPYLSEFPELVALGAVFGVLTLASFVEERLRSRGGVRREETI